MPFHSTATLSGGKVDYVAVTAGVTVLVLLALLALTAGVATGVVLARRALKKRKHPEGNGETREKTGIIEMSGATEEEEVHNYAVVNVYTSIDGRAMPYQELHVDTPDYVNVYNELKGGTYQELDLKSREEEHHYQRPHTNREREGYGRRVYVGWGGL